MTGFCDLNLKFPMILAISVFMSISNFMLSWVEHEKTFITSEPGLLEVSLNAQLWAYLTLASRNFVIKVSGIDWNPVATVCNGSFVDNADVGME